MNPFNNDSHIKQDHVFPTQLEKRKYLTEIIHDSTHVHYDDKINNIGLYIKTGNLSHILFMDEMYQLIKDVPGVIFKLGHESLFLKEEITSFSKQDLWRRLRC